MNARRGGPHPGRPCRSPCRVPGDQPRPLFPSSPWWPESPSESSSPESSPWSSSTEGIVAGRPHRVVGARHGRARRVVDRRRGGRRAVVGTAPTAAAVGVVGSLRLDLGPATIVTPRRRLACGDQRGAPHDQGAGQRDPGDCGLQRASHVRSPRCSVPSGRDHHEPAHVVGTPGGGKGAVKERRRSRRVATGEARWRAQAPAGAG